MEASFKTMGIKKTTFFIGFFFFSLSLLFSDITERPQGFVNDYAGLLSLQTKNRLESILTETEKRSGIEFAVVIVQSMEGNTIEEYAEKIFSSWKIGKKGKDNGVLLLVSLSERKVRIETGYGLEEVLTDGLCGEILDRYFSPYARNSEYDKAFIETVSKIISILSERYGFTIDGLSSETDTKSISFLNLLILIFILSIIFGRFWFLFFPFFGGRFIRGSFFGGGGGFRGTGGFGGFGGGLSGGGGASRGF